MDGEVKTTNAELDYIDYLNGMKYKEITEKYGVSMILFLIYIRKHLC